jgi:hypothetical protein
METNRYELVITALQQRIGEIVANYETQIAILRAELTAVTAPAEEETKVVETTDKKGSAKK